MESRKPSKKMSGAFIQKFWKPGIYAWRRGTEYLYIGISGSVFSRVFSHNVIGKAEKLRPKDTVEFWLHPEMSWFELAAAEAAMIEKYKPKYNIPTRRNGPKVCTDVKCPACGKVFTQIRWWQVFCNRKCQQSGVRFRGTIVG